MTKTPSPPTAAERASALLRGDGYMRLPDVLTLLGVSRSTFWQGIRDGRYPPGVKIGRRATAWSAGSIRALLERLAEGSQQRAA